LGITYLLQLMDARYLILRTVRKVIDVEEHQILSFSQYKKDILSKIKDEQVYQKNVRQRDIKAKFSYPFALPLIQQEWNKEVISQSDKRIEDFKKQIHLLEIRRSKQIDIGTIKEIPITNYLNFKYNKTRCIFHNEKTPSLTYYPDKNTVYCFGSCGKSFDVIDVVAKINNLTFIETINFLQQ